MSTLCSSSSSKGKELGDRGYVVQGNSHGRPGDYTPAGTHTQPEHTTDLPCSAPTVASSTATAAAFAVLNLPSTRNGELGPKASVATHMEPDCDTPVCGCLEHPKTRPRRTTTSKYHVQHNRKTGRGRQGSETKSCNTGLSEQPWAVGPSFNHRCRCAPCTRTTGSERGRGQGGLVP